MSYFYKMDVKTYIASGILENYILGTVSYSERQEVERYKQQYPEIKVELTAIEDALWQYTQAKACPMPKGLDHQILLNIDQLATLKNTSDVPERLNQTISDTIQQPSCGSS